MFIPRSFYAVATVVGVTPYIHNVTTAKPTQSIQQNIEQPPNI